MQDTPFVPGLYRMLANWPHLLAHLAVTLQPRLHASETQAAFATLRDRIDAAIPAVLSQLPPPSGRAPMPPAEDRAWFFEISDTYRKTSPEMIVAGRLVKDALAL